MPRVRVSPENLRRAIAQILDRDPDLSGNKIRAELHVHNIAVGNERLRALIALFRQTAQIFEGVNLLGATLDVNLSESQIRRAAVEAGAVIESIAARFSTHVAVDWRATFSARIYLYGQLIERVSDVLTGRSVQAVARYNRDLIEAKIEQQIFGRITSKYGGTGETYIEGLDIEIERLDVEVLSLALRGDSRARR